MINTQGFPGFYVAFVIKRLLYIEFNMFRKKKKRELEVQKDRSGLLPIFGSLSQRRILVPCRDSGWSA